MHGAVRANENLGQNKLRIPIENLKKKKFSKTMFRIRTQTKIKNKISLHDSRCL